MFILVASKKILKKASFQRRDSHDTDFFVIKMDETLQKVLNSPAFVHVLTYLPLNDIVSFSLVSKSCNEVTKSQGVWKHLFTIDVKNVRKLPNEGKEALNLQVWRRSFIEYVSEETNGKRHINSLTSIALPKNEIHFTAKQKRLRSTSYVRKKRWFTLHLPSLFLKLKTKMQLWMKKHLVFVWLLLNL